MFGGGQLTIGGVGNYKEFSGGDTAFVSQQGVTADLGLITAAINNWQAGGGGDNDVPEAPQKPEHGVIRREGHRRGRDAQHCRLRIGPSD
jgi:hypothetical protein